VKSRLILALILVPLAAALSYAAVLHLQFKDMEPRPTNVHFFWPGVAVGVAFEMLVLVPLWLVLRRLGVASFAAFVAVGLVLWIFLSFAVYAALMPLREALQTAAPSVLFGAVMVLVFAALAVRRTDA